MRPLITFFGLAYFISWTIWLPLYGHIFGLSNLPNLPFHHAIGGLGPFTSAFLSTWIFHKKAGVQQLLMKCFQPKPLIYLSIALFSPFLLIIIAALINYFVYKTSINLAGILQSKEFPQFSLFTFFIYNLIFFGFGEEVGWRGFALPIFQNKLNALAASLLLTVFWALWHLPLFFYRSGYTTMDMAGVFGWIFSLLTGSILLTWLYNSSKASILICAVFHSTIDIAFTADIADQNIINYMGFLITIWGILIILIFKPQNLATRERVKSNSS